MLKLNRKANEAIIISTPTGEDITVYLLIANRGQCKVGIEAPKNYKVLREELIDEYESKAIS